MYEKIKRTSMRKVLLLLLGILLIFILSYFCYVNKSEGIKNDLLTDAQNRYDSKSMNWVKTEIEGQDLKLTRTLILKGSTSSLIAKKEAEKIAYTVDGVKYVKNEIEIIPSKIEVVKKTVMPTPVVVKKVLKVQKPYSINVRKFKSGKIVLSGYVPSVDSHTELLNKAQTIYGEENVIDKLEEAKGAPNDWNESILLGLNNLVKLDYGQINMKDETFRFEGYTNSMEESMNLFKSFKENLPKNYQDEYDIKAPDEAVPKKKEKPKTELEKVSDKGVSCQEQFHNYLAKEKINFSYNKALIRKSSYALLNQLVEIAKSCPESKIVIEGHTDSDGSKKYNQRLSEKRAKLVKQYLVQHGIEPNRLESMGYGELKPLVENSTRDAKKQNRRIEFNVKGVK